MILTPPEDLGSPEDSSSPEDSGCQEDSGNPVDPRSPKDACIPKGPGGPKDSANSKDSTSSKVLRRLSHFELLVALVSLQVFQSFLSPDSVFQRSLFNVSFLVLVFSACRTLSRSRLRTYLVMGAGVLGYVLTSYNEVGRSVWLLAGSDACFLLVFVLLLASLGESVFGKGLSDLNRIIGAISIYFVIGLLFGLLFSLLETFHPGSFNLVMQANDASGHHETFNQLNYFSSVTLTTLGYGDIQPVSRPARTLATLEAMIGQLYLAIVVAQLVGVRIAQRAHR
ncbi:potassium channel family protein [Neorhodopirellula lusitana]|uniref:potassium channel family protein n=1 Tax=Neorhodopirellula lusitana TaxID=445327 RepID=UPI003851699B